jgi:ankyrin repeat protein
MNTCNLNPISTTVNSLSNTTKSDSYTSKTTSKYRIIKDHQNNFYTSINRHVKYTYTLPKTWKKAIIKAIKCVQTHIHNKPLSYEAFKGYCSTDNPYNVAQEIKANLYGWSYRKIKNWLITSSSDLQDSPINYAIKNSHIIIIKQLLLSLKESKTIFDPYLKDFLFEESDDRSRRYNYPISHDSVDFIIQNTDLKFIQEFFLLLKDCYPSYYYLLSVIYVSLEHKKADVLSFIFKFTEDFFSLDVLLNTMHNTSYISPLEKIVANQNIAILDILLSNGFDLSTVKNASTIVYPAIKNNDITTLELLTKHGASLNDVSRKIVIKTEAITEERTIWYMQHISHLEYAVIHSNQDTILWLILHGANHDLARNTFNKTTFVNTPLHQAILANNYEIVKLLLVKKILKPTDRAYTEEINFLNAIDYAKSLTDDKDRSAIMSILQEYNT